MVKIPQTISGKVTDAQGNPIVGVQVEAHTHTCWPQEDRMFACQTDSSGNYSIPVPNGSYYIYIYTDPAGDNNFYRNSWWTGTAMSEDCSNAISVHSNNTLNMTLNRAEIISGTVTDQEGNPLYNVCINAYADACYNNFVASSTTDEDGNYSLIVPPGEYYIITNANCQQLQPVVNEWWDGGNGTTDCTTAAPISVNQDINAIDFELGNIPDFPAPVIQKAGLVTREKPDGSTSTIFYLYLSGPSPEDIFSCVAEGPSGTFNLGPYSSIRQRGLAYLTVPGFIFDDGIYTLTVTDSKGRQATASQNFSYDNTVPRLDESSRLPVDQSYTGTETPSISFSSVGDGYFYKVYVTDYSGKIVWYNSTISQETSYTVPEGLLQPNTPYRWYVRVFDRDGQPNSCQESEVFSFYTGDGSTPNIDKKYVLSIEQPGYKGTWFGVRNANIAPWDITSLTVTDPDNNTYDVNGYGFYFTRPSVYSLTVGSPFPLADGTYNFHLETRSGSSISSDITYARNTLPEIDESSLSPANNTYFDSDSLTFSWAPLHDDNQPDRVYYYRIRIYSYDNKMNWYDSETTTGSSLTIPVAGNFAVGSSYRWRLVVYDDLDHNQNMTNSTKRVFTIANTPVAADFSSAYHSGSAPLTIAFLDNSQGNIAKWTWDFGDGSTSNERNPVHNYLNPGSYTVTLTVDDFYGNSNCQIKTEYVTVAAQDQPPVAKFTSSTTNGVSPLEVSFSDQSTGDTTSWQWDFGDNQTSNEQNPVHLYENPGLYTVTLTASGPGGNNTEIKTDFISITAPATPPIANFSSSSVSGTAPSIITFLDQSTGDITNYLWSFGDGGSSSLLNPSHSYAENGIYSVTLTVSGPGGSNSITKTHYITITEPIAPPLARFSALPAIGVAPLNVTFTDASTGDITSWQWNFGDGTTSSAKNPTHVYETAGEFDVSLTVEGPGGSNTTIKTHYVIIDEPATPPTAAFSADNVDGMSLPHNVTFNDQSTGDITSWQWNFGDGTTSSAKNPTHVYETTGEFNVSLTVEGPGGSNMITKNNFVIIAVDNVPPAVVVNNPPAPYTNLTNFHFTIGGNEVVAYRYQLDNGVISPSYDIAQPCNITYLADGNHTLAVYGRDAANNWQTQPTKINWTIDQTPPQAILHGMPQGIVGVNNITVQVSGEDVAFYKFQLDGGIWSNAVNVNTLIEISDLQDGAHTLAVIASDNLGNWQMSASATEANWSIDTSIPTATLSNLPPSRTNATSETILVGGTGVVAYRYKISGPAAIYNGNWSSEVNATTPISFAIAGDGSEDGEYTLDVEGVNNAGTWQGEGNATNYHWTIDTTAPPANSDADLKPGVPAASVGILTWTPVENDLWGYRVRLAKDSWSGWDSATAIYCSTKPGPSEAGFQEKLAINGLLPGTTYYAAIRSIDKAGNISTTSNIAAFTTANQIPVIQSFALIDNGSRSADNSSKRKLQIIGSNFLPGTANQVRFIHAGGATVIEKTSTVADATRLTVEVPAGIATGDYYLRVINNQGSSLKSTDLYHVETAALPVPQVTNVIPPTLPAGIGGTLTITGAHFVDGTTIPSTVSLLANNGLEIPLSINSATADTLEVSVPASVPIGLYDIKVTLVDRFNTSSAVKVDIYEPVNIHASTGTIITNSGIDMSDDTAFAGVVPVEVNLKSDMSSSNAAVSDNTMNIEANIEPGTAITANGEAYTGTIDPPRQVPPTDEVVGTLGSDAVVFTMGNTNEQLSLGSGQTMLVTMEVTIPSENGTPVVYYLEADGSIMLAGVDGQKDSIVYARGGSIMADRPDTPEIGQSTFTIGILLDHMSSYAVSTNLADNNGDGDVDGKDLADFISKLQAGNNQISIKQFATSFGH